MLIDHLIFVTESLMNGLDSNEDDTGSCIARRRSWRTKRLIS